MYLVFASTISASKIINELEAHHLEAIAIKTHTNFINQDQIDYIVSIINLFNYVILTAPTTIECLAPRLAKINIDNKLTFMTVGVKTQERLANTISTNKILYPLKSSGVDALINEVLLKLELTNSKVLVVGSNIISPKLSAYLNKNCGYYEESIVYQQELVMLNLDDLLMVDKDYKVIITSSKDVKYLFSQAQKFGYSDKLTRLTFYTLHKNIADLLTNVYSVSNVILSNYESINSLVETCYTRS